VDQAATTAPHAPARGTYDGVDRGGEPVEPAPAQRVTGRVAYMTAFVLSHVERTSARMGAPVRPVLAQVAEQSRQVARAIDACYLTQGRLVRRSSGVAACGTCLSRTLSGVRGRTSSPVRKRG